MSNDLQALEKFDVDYKPSTIKIKNESALAEMVESTAKYYETMVFTDDNIPEAKKARTDLNKIATLLDDQRKAVKRSYNEPLKLFEDKIKAYSNRIKSVGDGIKESIDEYESEQVKIRTGKINQLVDEMLDSHQLVPTDLAKLEIPKSWYTQSAFTKKGEPTKKTVEEVHGKLGYIALEKQRIAEAKNAVKDFATLSGLDPYAWENLIDQGLSSGEVIERIKQAVEQKKADEAEKEQQRIAKEEYDAAMAEIRKRSQEQVGNTVIDGSTGEIVTRIEQKETDEVMTFTLNITGPKSKLYELNRYMTEQGLTFQKV
ncbi:DUF1351 domain-containing protein [Enterococcus diestrammenae]|uniref:DUF1351 domain-containing protein n=1 Tax=Enterococcus diestrammenae TaxID=1155073 RepID=A0ABV0F5J6_9ENTE|nr:DUF1351 domain-containing protein [Enterococcus diestrammenae]KAF1299704.1 hypothetical protein BAU18_07185 [Enterococcus diestrammenae]